MKPYSLIKQMIITLGIALSAGFCVHTHAMGKFTIDSDGNCGITSHKTFDQRILDGLEQKMPTIGDTSLCKSLLDFYKNLSLKELNALRAYWKSSSFSSELRDEKNIKLIVDYAQQLRKDYKDYDLICGLGQSRSYEVLTAQILASLFGENTDRYLLIAFSGNFKNFAFPNKRKRDYYNKYLASLGFSNTTYKKIVICELVEHCKGLTSFMQLLQSVYNDKKYIFPEIKLNINLVGDYYFQSKTSLVQNSDVRIFDSEEKL